jgi:archaemetzincin
LSYKQIVIQPYELKDFSYKEFVSKKLKEIFDLPVIWLADEQLPLEAYNPKRKQFLGSYFLKELLKIKTTGDIVLGIVPVDLYEPDLNFIFGVASPITGTAVISLYRLHNSFYGLPENEKIFIERTIKEAVHEIGHVLGLPHCPNPICVMHFSNSIEDTDRKSYYFCESCYIKVKKALKI